MREENVRSGGQEKNVLKKEEVKCFERRAFYDNTKGVIRRGRERNIYFVEEAPRERKILDKEKSETNLFPLEQHPLALFSLVVLTSTWRKYMRRKRKGTRLLSSLLILISSCMGYLL